MARKFALKCINVLTKENPLNFNVLKKMLLSLKNSNQQLSHHFEFGWIRLYQPSNQKKAW